MTTTVVAAGSGSIESSSSAVRWGPIIAGAITAVVATLFLTLLASGLGLTMVSPFSSDSTSLAAAGVSAGVALIVIQWISSGVGGYLTGRLRTKWVGVHTDETFFRDTAHGLLAWALATLFMAGILGSALSSAASGGASAATAIASGVASGAAAGAGDAASSNDQATGYFVDALFRPADPSRLAAPGAEGNAAAAGEASRILVLSATAGEISVEDKAYLAQLVSARTGLAQSDAEARVQAVLDRIEQTKAQAQQAVETTRKSAATVSIIGALSLAVGAFIAAVAAAFGGRQRDDEEAAFVTGR